MIQETDLFRNNYFQWSRRRYRSLYKFHYKLRGFDIAILNTDSYIMSAVVRVDVATAVENNWDACAKFWRPANSSRAFSSSAAIALITFIAFRLTAFQERKPSKQHDLRHHSNPSYLRTWIAYTTDVASSKCGNIARLSAYPRITRDRYFAPIPWC